VFNLFWECVDSEGEEESSLHSVETGTETRHKKLGKGWEGYRASGDEE
jgi:hypothetical protein